MTKRWKDYRNHNLGSASSKYIIFCHPPHVYPPSVHVGPTILLWPWHQAVVAAIGKEVTRNRAGNHVRSRYADELGMGRDVVIGSHARRKPPGPAPVPAPCWRARNGASATRHPPWRWGRRREELSTLLCEVCEDFLQPGPRAGIPDPGGADNNFTRFLADHRTSRRCRMPTSRARPPWPPSSSRWPPSSPGCTAPWAPTRMEPPATGTISLIRQSKERDGDIEYIALCEKKTLIMGTDGYW
jgi:hypothetical protein